MSSPDSFITQVNGWLEPLGHRLYKDGVTQRGANLISWSSNREHLKTEQGGIRPDCPLEFSLLPDLENVNTPCFYPIFSMPTFNNPNTDYASSVYTQAKRGFFDGSTAGALLLALAQWNHEEGDGELVEHYLQGARVFFTCYAKEAKEWREHMALRDSTAKAADKARLEYWEAAHARWPEEHPNPCERGNPVSPNDILALKANLVIKSRELRETRDAAAAMYRNNPYDGYASVKRQASGRKYSAVEAPTVAALDSQSLALSDKPTALVVDDDASHTHLWKARLSEDFGLTVIMASDYAQGMEALKAYETQGTAPRLVLIDNTLPDDAVCKRESAYGLPLLRRLRESGDGPLKDAPAAFFSMDVTPDKGAVIPSWRGMDVPAIAGQACETYLHTADSGKRAEMPVYALLERLIREQPQQKIHTPTCAIERGTWPYQREWPTRRIHETPPSHAPYLEDADFVRELQRRTAEEEQDKRNKGQRL